MKGRKQFMIRHNNAMLKETNKETAEEVAPPNTYGALEMEAAAALLMLRYQYDIMSPVTTACKVEEIATTSIPSPPPTTSTPSPPPTTSTPSPPPTTTTPSPPPPPVEEAVNVTATAAEKVETDKCTPKEQVRTGPVKTAAKPLKKRSIPPHLLSRTLTPAKSFVAASDNNASSSCSNISLVKGGGIVKAKLKAPAAACNKALLKSCRNMIREFLDNQELI